ncbi:hypothetical protein [Paenibacillus physcomitrellae]|uniref:Uncharacterized protein n=1 Tax=Paenibacillus physcomitrellae TaxID=1619311 RepID=A0ABQ1FZY2_9BACL|nr:hypothetical protein [Paenibacillus physcomitrellae]GGA33321.1 hypothetical protein GCM10010917_18090 [Paenibacillus physcomitrellae]
MPNHRKNIETDGNPETVYEDTREHEHPILPAPKQYTTKPNRETEGPDRVKRT